ncbi:MAG: hypothetical protein ACO23V_11670, partial [Chitinophagaceae bacterium]
MGRITKKLDTQAEAVLYFLCRLDIDMVNELLDPTRTYADLPKARFIEKLGVAFNKFIYAGDESLSLEAGFCSSLDCDNCGSIGYTFVGNVSGHFMDLIVMEEEGKIIDIFDCTFLEVQGSSR